MNRFVETLMTDSNHALRLIFASNGDEPCDSLFASRFAEEFETHFVTFVRPTQDLKASQVSQLADFGPHLNIRRLNNLRIVIGTLWRIFQMKRYLKLIRPDIVVSNWVTTYGLYASVCGWRPFVLFAWGSDILIDPHRSFLHRHITRRVLDSADLVVLNSEAQRRAALELGCNPGKMISFPWVALEDLRQTVRDPTYRKQLGWQREKIVVSVRKHEPVYDVKTLIQAIPRILAQAPHIRFLIFGEGTQTPMLANLAREKKVEPFVHFAGDVPRRKLLGYVMDCEIYVSTSLSDGSSSSMLEAMSLGLPVVVTAIQGNAEWVSNGNTGLMFNGGDVDGLINSILWILDNPDQATAMKLRARRDIINRVSFDRATSRLIQRFYSVWKDYARNRR